MCARRESFGVRGSFEMLSDLQNSSISRTVQYKKITKPLLERKRRARINRCLDELKDLMMGALEAEGENISKLEKADILELTVRHLHRLHRPRNPVEEAQRFQAGFGRCAAEACQFLLSLPGIDTRVSQNLVKHLGAYATSVPLSIQVPNQSRLAFSPPLSPATPSAHRGYNREVLSSTPSVQDLSKPMAGLLMQVPKGQTARGALRNAILERRRNAALKNAAETRESGYDSDDDDDDEIDIERVDDKDMWRPW